MASGAPRAQAPHGTTTRPGLLAAFLTGTAQALTWLCLSLLIAIAIEWIGMVWWWPDEGLGHSRRMLDTELGYLQADFRRSLVTADPVRFARSAATRVREALLERTDFIGRQVGQARAAAVTLSLRGRLQQALRSFMPFVLAAVQVSALFAARLAILALALPLFGLFALVGLVDGLVRRDLRRWGGGRESSFVYHWAKRLTLPLLVFTGVFYLTLPFSVHPSAVVLPFATLFAVSFSVAASTFKKYL